MSDLEQRDNLEEQADGGQKKKFRMPKWIVAFLGILLIECALTFVLLPALAYAAFCLRLSTEMVRAGITLLYALPCLVGGLLVRRFQLEPSLLWSAAVGAAYYGVLLAVSAAAAGQAMAGWEVPILCVASAFIGFFLRKKRRIE